MIAFVLFFVLHLVSPRGMGFGDVKLSFVLGLSLGWLGWGEMVARPVPRVPLRRGDRPPAHRHQAAGPESGRCPFGPFLAAGAITAILVGTAIVDWYRGS